MNNLDFFNISTEVYEKTRMVEEEIAVAGRYNWASKIFSCYRKMIF